MKILLLSVALLFFTGAQGRYFWQQDEPTEDHTIEKIFHDGVSMIAGVIKSLDLQEIAKEYHIKEKFEAAKKHSDKLEKALERYSEAVWNRFDQQLSEKFPVLKEKVFPILKEFDDKLEEEITKLVKEAVPVGSDLVSGISKHFIHFFENLERIAEKSRDNVHGEIDSLRGKLQPYADEVHAEYERFRKSLKDKLHEDVKEIKEGVEQKVEEVKEHLSNKLPDGKEFQEHVEKLLKEIKEYLEGLY